MNENNKKSYKISASILSADFAKLGQEIDEVLRFGVDMIHFDVMDNHYVPNLTFGPLVCKALREHGIKAPIDVHLMTCPVERLILEFARAGATYITFHTGACNHVDRALQMVLDSGCKAGIALNPASTTNHLNYILQKLDIVLVMSVKVCTENSFLDIPDWFVAIATLYPALFKSAMASRLPGRACHSYSALM